jgi:hypothetical protein
MSRQRGISIRFVHKLDVKRDRTITRMDVLYGFSVTPDMACRVVDGPDEESAAIVVDDFDEFEDAA